MGHLQWFEILSDMYTYMKIEEVVGYSCSTAEEMQPLLGLTTATHCWCDV